MFLSSTIKLDFTGCQEFIRLCEMKRKEVWFGSSGWKETKLSLKNLNKVEFIENILEHS